MKKEENLLEDFKRALISTIKSISKKKDYDIKFGNAENVSENSIFNQDTNKIYFTSKLYSENWELMTKKEVAKKLCQKISLHLNN